MVITDTHKTRLKAILDRFKDSQNTGKDEENWGEKEAETAETCPLILAGNLEGIKALEGAATTPFNDSYLSELFRALTDTEGFLLYFKDVDAKKIPFEKLTLISGLDGGFFKISDNLFLYRYLQNGSFSLCFVESTFEAMIDFAESYFFSKINRKEAQINYLVMTRHSGLDIENAPLLYAQPLDEANYAVGFADFNKEVLDWTNDWKSTGLSIFHGEPGTGKTSYLRHLCSEKRNLVYIPSNLASEIGNPGFTTFLTKNRQKVIVIEDAENIVISDGTTRTAALQNILNATDGFLADIIQCKFILTFNTDLKNVDSALLREGRAKVVYEFKPLCADRSDALLEKLGKEKQGKPMTLAQIYNAAVIGGDILKPKEKVIVGFNTKAA
jgi:hypothetical protein